MATFVMVINQITSEQFEKMIAIQVKSGDKIKFVPQPTNNHAVTTQQFTSSVQNVNRSGQTVQEQVYANVRLEWTDDGAKFAREIFDVFIREDQKAQKAG